MAPKVTPKMTTNPFFNFLRSFRTLNGYRQADLVKYAAIAWKSLSDDEKFEYYKNAMLFKRSQILNELL